MKTLIRNGKTFNLVFSTLIKTNMNIELCTTSSADSILPSSVTRFFLMIPNSDGMSEWFTIPSEQRWLRIKSYLYVCK